MKDKESAEQLRQQREWLSVTLRSIGDAVIATDREGRVTFLNPVAEQATGWKSAEAQGQPLEKVFHIINEKTRRIAENPVERVLREGNIVGLANHTTLIRKDGLEIPIEDSAAPIRDSGGDTIGVVMVFHDVTERRRAEAERKRAEEAVHASEERYRSLFENMLDGFAYCRMIYDGQGRPEDFVYLDVNGAFGRLTGLENVIGKKVTEVIPGVRESNPELFEIYGRASMTGQPERFETEVRPLGIWFSISVYSPAKEHFVAVFDNITERKRAEERVAHLASFPKLNPNFIIETDTEGNVTYVNPAAGKSFPELLETGRHPILKDWPSVIAEFKKGARRTIVRELEVGGLVFNQSLYYSPDMGFIRVYNTDITEHRREEDERKITVEFLRIVNQSSGTRDLVRSVVNFIKEQSGFEAVGIRLKEGDDFPYFETHGFPAEFVRMESSLCARNGAGDIIRDDAGNPVLSCMCGNVIRERFDPSKPFFTELGNFWTSSTTELLANTTEADRQARTRNRCNGEGYESMALIALRVGTERLGLLQLNDRRKGLLTPEAVAHWERLAGYLAVALSKFRSEEALKESEAQFRTLADAIPQLCWMANADGWLFWYNKRWYEYTGTTPEQMEGWGWQSVHDPEELPEVMDKWRASIATGNPFEMVFPLRDADGVFRPFLTRGVPVRDAEGKVVRWFGTNTDIAEQKRFEEELEGLVRARTAELDSKNIEIRRQSEQLSVTLKSIGDAVIATDRDGRVTFMNPVAEQATGWESAEAQGQPLEKVFRIINEQTRRPAQNPVVKVLQEGHVVGLANHTALVRKDGSELPIEDSAAPIRGAGGDIIGVVLVFHDVTEKRRSEEALKESEERFRLMVSGVQDYAILMLSPTGEVVSWNEGAERIKGYTAPEIIGRNFSCFYPREDVLAGKPARQLEYAASMGTFEGEGLRVRKDGSSFWANTVITAMYDEDGSLRGFSKVTRDISERKRLEDEALRTQKLESLRVLAGGIAHDLNNMMVAVEGNAGLALRSLGNDALVKEYLTGIEDAAEKVAGFSKQILSFTGKKDEHKEPVRLNDVVKETGRLLIASISKKAELGYNLADGLPVIMANPQNMQQVVMNLILNASDALGDGKGMINISTGMLNAGRQYLDTLHPAGLPEGEYVYVEVSDTGCGMSQETRRRIFDPFFTTKFMGRGLGLSAVFGIAIGHGGGVGLQTEEGCGATFRVLLPVPVMPVEAAPVGSGRPEKIRDGKGTILVVDDEEDSRMMAKKVLETVGYKVLTAADGAEGIEVYKKNRDSVAAVIMDLVMPHVRGDEAAREMRNIREDINILLLSGYHEIEMKELMEGLGRTVVLEKPYKITRLLEKVQGMLEV
jgi:PAS domain S-box-containing protein